VNKLFSVTYHVKDCPHRRCSPSKYKGVIAAASQSEARGAVLDSLRLFNKDNNLKKFRRECIKAIVKRFNGRTSYRVWKLDDLADSWLGILPTDVCSRCDYPHLMKTCDEVWKTDSRHCLDYSHWDHEHFKVRCRNCKKWFFF
jgi:hypothetical protein